AGIDERPFTPAEQIKECCASLLRNSGEAKRLHSSFVAAKMEETSTLEPAAPVLDVLGNIYHDRSRTSAAGHLESRAHGGFELLGLVNQEDMLGARTHDVEYGSFLKGVRADGVSRHLAANQHHGNR